MINFDAEEKTFVVIPAIKHFGVVEVGQQFTSGQEVEIFTDEQAARLRAVEIGWTDENLDEEDLDIPDTPETV